MAVKAFYSTFDTSTVGLMAIHILDGELPLFYYGQNYMGALEAYAAALMFQIFGISTTTLSLSPIAFAVAWIAATYRLFKELFDWRSGLAAALCTAAAGWHPMWLSMSSYGGYPAFFFLGTCFLSMAVSCAKGVKASPTRQWRYAVGMGAAAALGVWTNFQVFSYLATGALVLIVWIAAGRFERAALVKLTVAGCIGVLGFLPLAFAIRECGFSSQTMHGPTPRFLRESALMLFRLAPELLLWPRVTRAVAGVALLCCFGALALYVWKVISSSGRARLLALVPLLYVAVFLALYLPHPMARIGAPRYLVPFIMMIVCAVFGASVTVERRAVRCLGWGFVAVWVLFNTSCAIATAQRNSGTKAGIVAARNEVVSRAAAAGVRHVTILGSAIDGLEGQTYTFYSKGRIRFVSSYYERHAPSAESAELDPASAFLCKAPHLEKCERSLAAAGITAYDIERSSRPLIHSIVVPHWRRRSVAPQRIRAEVAGAVRGDARALVDRAADTYVEFERGQSHETATVTLDLGSVAAVDGVTLTAFQSEKLPATCEIRSSIDGMSYDFAGGSAEKMLPTYVSGNRAYMMGYFARYELRSGPAEARYLRIAFRWPGSGSSVRQINEIYVFERLGADAAITRDEVASIALTVEERGIDFVVADRWLSARLRDRLPSIGGSPVAYPRFNPRFRDTLISREFAPRKGLAVVVDRSLSEECAAILQEETPRGAELIRVDFRHYTFFTFLGPDSVFLSLPRSLVWRGYALLKISAADTLR